MIYNKMIEIYLHIFVFSVFILNHAKSFLIDIVSLPQNNSVDIG